MKRIVTIAIIIFWIIYISIVAGGVAVHKLSAGSQSSQTTPTVVDTKALGQITLDATEVAKHADSNSCWMIINGKVYDITTYFGSHPGRDQYLAMNCGKDATRAFQLVPHQHSAYATSLLGSYLLGNLGETINQSHGSATSAPVTGNPPSTNSASTTPPASGSTYTASDVATHNTSSNCWIIVSGSVYNISSYLGSHPAGAAIIAPFCGKESTNAFKYSPHVHSGSATSLLAKYFVGTIGTVTTGTGTISTPINSTTGTTPVSKENDDDDD